VVLDEDLPGDGKHFCITCSKYFINNAGLLSHQKGKPHKRRMGLLLDHKKAGTKPHTAQDAEAAGGMGPTDNGPKLRSTTAAVAVVAMATE
jgi:bud site selection protein 20